MPVLMSDGCVPPAVPHLCCPPLQVCLMSRDMQNVLVTTFAELKQCFERSFRELFEASLAKDPPTA